MRLAHATLLACVAFAATLASTLSFASEGSADPLQLLEERRFEELDGRMTKLQRGYASGSVSDLDLLAAVRHFYTTDPKLEARFNEWLQRYPRSYMARVARGIYYKRVGAEARGDRYADETSADQLAEMKLYYGKAMEDFQASVPLETQPILSYLYMMDILKYSPPVIIRIWLLRLKLENGTRHMLNEANRVAPANFIARRKYMLTLQGRWGGSPGAMSAFLAECKTAGLPHDQLNALAAFAVADRAWMRLQRNDPRDAVDDYRDALALIDFGSDRLFEHGQRALLLQEIGYAHQLLRDYRASARYLTLAIEAGADSSDVYVSRGISYFHSGDKKEGLQDYLRGAERGSAWAQDQVGVHYWHGIIFSQDRREATRWFRRAAGQGFEEARKHLYWATKQCPEC